MVRSPVGSTSRASLMASLLAMSLLAGEIARMIVLGCRTYARQMSRICASMSGGWSPTGTLVMPGKSTMSKSGTLGE